MKGIFIPVEFFQIEELNYTEMMVLALYKYYTEQGKYKCCSMTNQDICKIFNMSDRNLRKIKLHLKELGFIKTDGGIKVKYLGVKGGTTVPQGKELQCHKGGTAMPKGRNYNAKGEESQFPHKKENKEKEIEKRVEPERDNFNRVIEVLPSEYKSIDMIDYLYEEHKDMIDKINGLNDITCYKYGIAEKIKGMLSVKLPTNNTVSGGKINSWDKVHL